MEGGEKKIMKQTEFIYDVKQSDTSIGSEGATKIGEYLMVNSSLTELDLSGNCMKQMSK